MAFHYQSVVPWGRSFDEYERMFGLTADDLNRSILGCADGPASFNAYLSQSGRRVISCDPLYQFTTQQIQARIDATYEDVISFCSCTRTFTHVSSTIDRSDVYSCPQSPNIPVAHLRCRTIASCRTTARKIRSNWL